VRAARSGALGSSGRTAGRPTPENDGRRPAGAFRSSQAAVGRREPYQTMPARRSRSRSFSIRASIGGCVENSAVMPPPESGLAM